MAKISHGPVGSESKPCLQSNTLTHHQSLNKRTSRAPPPTSYDNYVAHQRRMAQNRVSCAPTIHSRASLAAEAREIMDKDEQEMAETFFMA